MIVKIPVIGGPHDGAEYSIPLPASPVLVLPVLRPDRRIPPKSDYRPARYVLRGSPMRYVYEHLVNKGAFGDGRFPTTA